MTIEFTESVVEQAALAWLESMAWVIKHGSEIAPGEVAAERQDYGKVILEDRLRQALARLNPGPLARVADAAYTFVVLNMAAAVAFGNFITGRKAVWLR